MLTFSCNLLLLALGERILTIQNHFVVSDTRYRSNSSSVLLHTKLSDGLCRLFEAPQTHIISHLVIRRLRFDYWESLSSIQRLSWVTELCRRHRNSKARPLGGCLITSIDPSTRFGDSTPKWTSVVMSVKLEVDEQDISLASPDPHLPLSLDHSHTNITQLEGQIDSDTQYTVEDILVAFAPPSVSQESHPSRRPSSTMSSSRSGRSGGSSSHHRSSKSSKKPRAVQVSHGLLFVLPPYPLQGRTTRPRPFSNTSTLKSKMTLLHSIHPSSSGTVLTLDYL